VMTFIRNVKLESIAKLRGCEVTVTVQVFIPK
jgi:hypothetical protein